MKKPLSQIVREHVKLMAEKKSDSTLPVKVERILNGPGHVVDVHINAAFTVGQVLRPIRELKIWLNNKLETYDKSHTFIIYRINAHKQEFTYPEDPGTDIPRMIFLVYRDVNFFDLPCQKGLLQVTPTLTILQLMNLLCNCETLGKINAE